MIFSLTQKSAKNLGALFFALVACTSSCSAESLEPAAFKAGIGLSATYFDYREFDNTGRVLDTEQGIVPGLSFTLGQRRSDWEWEGIASYQHGQVPYDGQTNFGNAYSTRTDETITDIALRLGYWLGEDHPVMPYAGLGYRRWDRDILPGTSGGLFESYRWNYLWLGVKPLLIMHDSSQLALDIGLIKPLRTELRVDFEGAYNIAPILYPQGSVGLRVLLTAKRMLSRSTEMTIEPYYEFWELGRSPSVTMSGITVYEPDSKTSNFGLNLRFDWTL